MFELAPLHVAIMINIKYVQSKNKLNESMNGWLKMKQRITLNQSQYKI